MTPAIIESPYAGDIERNTLYARRALRDALERGYAPLASHLLYTQPGVLDEHNPDERAWGIEAGLVWLPLVRVQLFYQDYGWSKGMYAAAARGRDLGVPQEFFTIGVNPDVHGK